MAGRGRRKGAGKRQARLLELFVSPLWLLLIFVVWNSGASLKAVALTSGAAAVYYLFFVPRTCGALRSDGKKFCKEDGRGFLVGCGRMAHLSWNLRKYFAAGRRQRRVASAPGRTDGSQGPGNAAVGSISPKFPKSELLAGFEAAVATLSLIVTILAWVFPQT